ncbi:MAG: hypothetical protein ACHQ2F_03250 [Desulfobaccales bacterium]
MLGQDSTINWEKVGKIDEALFVEISVDVDAYEARQKTKIPLEGKMQLIIELYNSCIIRRVVYKDNPLREALLSLPWKEEEITA